MNIEEFLAEIFIDFYEHLLLSNGEVEDCEEFDSLFYNEDDMEMSDCEFLSRYHEDICNEEIINDVYYYLIDDGCDFIFSLEKIISHFVIYYIYDNYVNKDLKIVMDYLKNNDLIDIVNFFKTNEAFGKNLIENYLKNYESDIDFDAVSELIYNSGDGMLLDKWKMLASEYYSINELLRRVIINLYDFYISNGCDDVTALRSTWHYFYRDFDPIGELDDMGIDYEMKVKYKAYIIKIMFADVYEDILNNSIIDSTNILDKYTNDYVILSVNSNRCIIPEDDEIRNRFLKYFILLHYEKEKRIENREKTIKDGRSITLKRIHPGHIFDVIDFSKK